MQPVWAWTFLNKQIENTPENVDEEWLELF